MENNNIAVDEQKVEQKVDAEPQQPEGDSISGYVKQDIVSQLVEMGFSKNVAEKACFFNQSILEKSIEWIYEHQQDPDFEEELRIVGKEQGGEPLSEEDIKKRAKELQEYARKRYQEKQKQLEEEQEKNRVRQSKFII
jgi:uncharacterized UBP type Zn finger protein